MSILSKSREETSAALVPASQAAQQSIGAGVPRARLMPPELAQNQRKRAVRRNLRILIAVVAVLVIGAVGGSVYLALAAQSALATAQQETSTNQAQLGKLAGVKNTQQWILDAEAAKRVGGSTDVDWSQFFGDLQSHLPSGVSLTGISVDSADALTPVAQSEIPLEKERIATVTFTATTAQLPQIPDWIDGLSSLKGFADATPGSVMYSDSDKTYSASVVMHLNEEVFSHRFAEEKKK